MKKKTSRSRWLHMRFSGAKQHANIYHVVYCVANGEKPRQVEIYYIIIINLLI